MLGSIAAILIVVWFYKSALDAGKNAVSWGCIGLVVYFIPALVWSYVVTPGLKDAFEHNRSPVIGFIVSYAYIAVGVACATWVRYRLCSQNDTQ